MEGEKKQKVRRTPRERVQHLNALIEGATRAAQKAVTRRERLVAQRDAILREAQEAVQ